MHAVLEMAQFLWLMVKFWWGMVTEIHLTFLCHLANAVVSPGAWFHEGYGFAM